MAETYEDLILEQRFHQVAYALIVFASIFIIARVSIQIWRQKPMQLQDYLLYIAYGFFLVMSICYLVIAPKMYLIERVSRGVIRPWPTMKRDIVTYVRFMFVTHMCFWVSLWLVKFSLLILYKRLLTGLPIIYLQIWWAVLIFCLIVSPFEKQLH